MTLAYISHWGWSGGAKVSCILCHRDVQLILAYSWARPAILVAGKGREVMFLFLLFLHFHSCSSFFPVPLFHLFCYLFCRFFSLSLGDDTKWPTRVDVSLNPNTINQYISHFSLMYWLSRYLDPVTLAYISHSSDLNTFYIDISLSLGCIIRKVSAEDIAIRGHGTGLEYMCSTRHFVYIFFQPSFPTKHC